MANLRPKQGLGSQSVEVLTAFGSHGGTQLRDSILFADPAGEYLVHPVGRLISFRHVETGEATYGIESQRVQAVTACAVAHNRSLLAVCERCNAKPFSQVTIYNLAATSEEPARQPSRTLQDLGAVGEICCAAFSADEECKLLAVASAPPELSLVVVEWRTNHVVGRFQLSERMDRISMSPLEDGVVSASGPKGLRLWTLKEEIPQAVAGEQPQDELVKLNLPKELAEATLFGDHAWLDPANGCLAVCAEEGHVHLVRAVAAEAPKLLRTISDPFRSMGQVPHCIRAFQGGFALGGDEGTLSLWEQQVVSMDSEDRVAMAVAMAGAIQHVQTTCARPGTTTRVCCIDVAGGAEAIGISGEQTEEMLAISFADRNVGLVSLQSIRDASNNEAACDLMCGGFHPGPVTSLDMAMQRPIVVTACRSEFAVRIWNYASRRCELRWEFPGEEPLSVSIHPLGYLLAVGFSDKLRIMQVLVDELKLHREFLHKGVRIVRFSFGGQYLAVAQGKMVIVYNVRTLAKVATLRGHAQLVRAVTFDPDDKCLTTCGEDGSIVEWSTQSWGKLQEYAADRSLGGIAYAITSGSQGRSYVSVVEDAVNNPRSLLRSLKQCEKGGRELDLPDAHALEAMRFHEGEFGPSVFGASASGSLCWFTGQSALAERRDFGLHSGACHDVQLAAHCGLAATAGEDGAVFILRISGLTLARGGDGPGDSHVVMLNRNEIQVREEEIQRLRSEAATLKVQLVEDSARMQSECIARVTAARTQDQEQIRSLRSECETLQQASTQHERESLRQIKAMEATHVQAADQMEGVYDRRLRKEGDRFAEVEAELRQMVDKLETMREDARQRLESQRMKQQRELAAQVGKKDEEVQRLQDIIKFSRQRFDMMLDQESMQQDKEVSKLTKEAGEELEKQRLLEYKLKKEQDTVLRGLDMMAKDHADADKKGAETVAEVASFEAEVEKLQREVDSLKSERREREATLREKELEIGSYKTKVNTLKKFKQVLDFRLREVTLSLQPKDDTITQLGAQVRELEEQFEENLEIDKDMKANLKSYDEKIKKDLVDCSRLRDIIKQRDKTIYQFTEDLRNLATNETDVRKWPDGIRQIYKAHAKPELMSKDADGEAMQELHRQIHSTEKKAGLMLAKGKSDEDKCQSDIRKMVEDNSKLIKELEDLRKSRKELQGKVKDLDLRVRDAEHQPMIAREACAAIQDRPTTPGTRRTVARSAGPTPVPQAQIFTGSPRAHSSQASRKAKEPFAVGKLRRPGNAHRHPEERRQQQKLMRGVAMGLEQAHHQRLEHKLLQDHYDHHEHSASPDAVTS